MWGLLTSFSHIYCEKWKQNAEQKDLENLELNQERGTHKVQAKRGKVAEETSAMKNAKCFTLGW